MIRFLLRIFWLPLALLALWAGGLMWFVGRIPLEPSQNKDRTDAIIVLTGGKSRIDDALALLESGVSDRLFVSGVPPKVTTNDLLRQSNRHWSLPVSAKIVLGHEATDTNSNAKESAEWVKQEQIKSLRLVTAAYHLPRSLYEFHRMMPEVTIIPNPVFPDDFKREGWWNHPGSTQLIMLEYHKYLAVVLHEQLLRWSILERKA